MEQLVEITGKPLVVKPSVRPCTRRWLSSASKSMRVWVRLLRAGDEKDIMTPWAYIYRVARNVLHDFYHRKGREDAVIVVDSDAAAHAAEDPMQSPPDALPSDSDSEQNFQREIARLPTVHRQIIRMRIHERMSHSEIASRLGVEVETVKRYLRMAIARLEKQQ